MDNATNFPESEKPLEKLEIIYEIPAVIFCMPRISLVGVQEISVTVTTIQDELPLESLRQRAMKSVTNNLLTYLKDENKKRGKTNIEKTLSKIPPPLCKEIFNQHRFKSIHEGEKKTVTSLETLLNIAERYHRVDVLAVLIKNGADRTIQPMDLIIDRMNIEIEVNINRNILYGQMYQNQDRLISDMINFIPVSKLLISSRNDNAHYYPGPVGPIIIDQNGKVWDSFRGSC